MIWSHDCALCVNIPVEVIEGLLDVLGLRPGDLTYQCTEGHQTPDVGCADCGVSLGSLVRNCAVVCAHAPTCSRAYEAHMPIAPVHVKASDCIEFTVRIRPGSKEPVHRCSPLPGHAIARDRALLTGTEQIDPSATETTRERKRVATAESDDDDPGIAEWAKPVPPPPFDVFASDPFSGSLFYSEPPAFPAPLSVHTPLLHQFDEGGPADVGPGTESLFRRFMREEGEEEDYSGAPMDA